MDPEVNALAVLVAALEPLSPEARTRALVYLCERYCPSQPEERQDKDLAESVSHLWRRAQP